MEGKLHQANENRKRRMMNQSGPHHTQKYRNNSTGGFTPRHNEQTTQTYRPNYKNNNGGPPKPGGNNNPNHSNPNHNNHHPNGNSNNTNTGPRTGSNATPITPNDKATITCYKCGTVGNYSNECPKKLAKTTPNTAAPAQQQRCFAGRRNQNNNNGRLYHMDATEAQEAPQTMPTRNNHSIGQNAARLDAPMPVMARQSAHGHRPGRASTPRRLVAVVLLSPYPFARMITTIPAPRQTPPLAVACAVDEDSIQPLPRRYRKDGNDAACSRPPLAMPSSALAPPISRLHDAPITCPFTALERH
ncbi:hypothetical protein QYE76_009967 [Lolium multiflorum]|uniref:CCHC-type domain-containing protein n=1 Tax=Lolium multiflorum TaxID=4521 RepID=A0AAD8TWD4_LOLMU|nr:hypothetical protein QYE76_009967 [Lolium multiflorum]